MKKLFAILALSICFSAQAQVYIKWPDGLATSFSPGVGGTAAVTIVNNMSYVGTIPTLTANATLSITVSNGVKAGALMLVAVKTTSTETTTFAGSIVAPVVTGAEGKTWTQAFIYNGTKFYPCGAKIQVD